MRRFIITCFTMLLIIVLAGCEEVIPDYTTVELEEALNNGEVVDGKTVEIEVLDLKPASAFGYNIFAGEHLNFVSVNNPEVEVGDVIVVKVVKVASMLGSFIITYEK